MALSTFLELAELGHVQLTAERPWESTPWPAFLRCMGLLRSIYAEYNVRSPKLCRVRVLAGRLFSRVLLRFDQFRGVWGPVWGPKERFSLPPNCSVLAVARLNYRHLEYFCYVAREGGVTAASRALHVGQPAISAQIRKLERALGEELFDRTGRTMVLTQVGRIVYGYGDEIFSMGRDLKVHALDIEVLIAGVLPGSSGRVGLASGRAGGPRCDPGRTRLIPISQPKVEN